MRAIQINYREGCTVTGIQIVGFPDHLSDDFIKGFETALRKVETVKSFEHIDSNNI